MTYKEARMWILFEGIVPEHVPNYCRHRRRRGDRESYFMNIYKGEKR